MVLKRLTGTRTSRHSPSGAAGSGRSASRSSSQRVWRVRLRCLTRFLQETRICGSVAKVTTATHPQCLVDGAFELAMLLFNIAVLVRHAEVVGRGLQAVMQHQQLVAPLGLRAPVGIQRMNGRAQVIGAMLTRCAAYLPQARLEPFDQRLEAF